MRDLYYILEHLRKCKMNICEVTGMGVGDVFDLLRCRRMSKKELKSWGSGFGSEKPRSAQLLAFAGFTFLTLAVMLPLWISISAYIFPKLKYIPLSLFQTSFRTCPTLSSCMVSDQRILDIQILNFQFCLYLLQFR